MAFNRDRNFQRGGFKKDFSDRGSRRSVEMHSAVCDECGKNCTVPFRPTEGKPVYCRDCFGKMKNSERNDGRSDEKNTRISNYNQQLSELNSKLDRILKILTPKEVISDEALEAKVIKPTIKEKISKPKKKKTVKKI